MPKKSISKKAKILSELKKAVEECQLCLLSKNRTRVVFGAGLPTTKIMFISEAPGFWEDQKGLPFVGRAGQLLDELLASIGFKREEIYITNVVKCRPPKNRKPTKKEIEACLPWLKKQIEIISPLKIILLGGVAFSIFFPKQRLGKFRGRWIKKEGRQFFITYHPAAGLRFPKIRTCLRRDFVRLGRTLIR